MCSLHPNKSNRSHETQIFVLEFHVSLTLTALVYGEQETEPEWICLAKYKETNSTSNSYTDVFSIFPG